MTDKRLALAEAGGIEEQHLPSVAVPRASGIANPAPLGLLCFGMTTGERCRPRLCLLRGGEGQKPALWCCCCWAAAQPVATAQLRCGSFSLTFQSRYGNVLPAACLFGSNYECLTADVQQADWCAGVRSCLPPVSALSCCCGLSVMLMFITTTWAEDATIAAVLSYAIFYGGFGQMVAGVFEVRGCPTAKGKLGRASTASWPDNHTADHGTWPTSCTPATHAP